MQHSVTISADDRKVCLGVENDLARLASELSKWGQVMRLDVSLTVRAVAFAEVKAADRARRAVVALGVPSEPGVAFGPPVPAKPLCFLTGLYSIRELLAG